jgi:large subunit ribosomal protein L35Ae
MSIKTDILLAVYVKGKHLSFQRGKRNTNPNCSLVKIEGVDDTNAAKYVLQVHTD